MKVKVNYQELVGILTDVQNTCRKMPKEMMAEIVAEKSAAFCGYQIPIPDINYSFKDYTDMRLIHSVIGKCRLEVKKTSCFVVSRDDRTYRIDSGIIGSGYFLIDPEQQ